MLEGVGSRRGGCRADEGGPRRVRDAARHPSTGWDPKKPHCQGAGFLGLTLLSFIPHGLRILAALSLAVVISLGWRQNLNAVSLNHSALPR